MRDSIFNKNYSCELSVSDLRLWVHLGCSPEERLHVQPVSLCIKLFFLKAPKGIQTDQLEDTCCYRHLTELAAEVAQHKPFNLIEHLAVSIHEVICSYLMDTGYNDIHLIVTINKLSPPIPNILGGVSFSYSGHNA